MHELCVCERVAIHAFEIEIRNGVCKGRQWENGRDRSWLWVTGLREDESWVVRKMI